MAYRAVLVLAVAMLAQEIPSHTNTRTVRQVCSSWTCPHGSTLPGCCRRTLRWLAKRDDVCGNLREATAYHFNLMLDAGEYCSFITSCVSRLQPQQQLDATLRAGVLREKQNAGLCLLSGSSISKPCRQGHPRCVLRCEATHVK